MKPIGLAERLPLRTHGLGRRVLVQFASLDVIVQIVHHTHTGSKHGVFCATAKSVEPPNLILEIGARRAHLRWGSAPRLVRK